ncbi:WxL domain-containing protein [Neobacillus vireti]|uniref:WxL domain-containing protein n=1 Tax=Neobacillus vireti TaxID=220686 RepID=UPI002FFFFBF6
MNKIIYLLLATFLFLYSISCTPLTTEADTFIMLPPDSITAQSNLTGTVTAIQESTSAPDLNWLQANKDRDPTFVHGTFFDTTYALKQGSNLQNVTFLIQKSDKGGINPSATLSVYEKVNGSLKTVASQTISSIGDTPVVITLSFDAASLTDKTGANLEWEVSGTASAQTGNGNRRTVETGAVNFNATLSVAPFGAPPNFSSTQLTGNSVVLTWNAVYQAISYQVKRNGVVIYTGSNLQYSDTGLNDAATYTYTVTAFNGTIYSAASTLTIKTPGILSISVPSISNFPNIIFTDYFKTSTTNFSSGMTIKDSTGSNMGWNVTVQASQFQESGGKQLPKGSLTLNGPITFVPINGTTSPNPVNLINSPTVIDNGNAIKIISANAGNGAGEYQATFPNNALNLSINLTSLTANQTNKTYTTTLSFTIVQGP